MSTARVYLHSTVGNRRRMHAMLGPWTGGKRHLDETGEKLHIPLQAKLAKKATTFKPPAVGAPFQPFTTRQRVRHRAIYKVTCSANPRKYLTCFLGSHYTAQGSDSPRPKGRQPGSMRGEPPFQPGPLPPAEAQRRSVEQQESFVRLQCLGYVHWGPESPAPGDPKHLATPCQRVQDRPSDRGHAG